MKKNHSAILTISQKSKLHLLNFFGPFFIALLMITTAQGQTYTSAQTINITTNGNYQFSVKGGAGTGKFHGDVRDANAVSANGNWGGTGATITANFYLLSGDIVYIIPGSAAQYDSAPVGGGGGGSAVIVERAGSFHLLVVAGGGGGGGYTEIGLGGRITNYNGTQTAAGGTGEVGGGGGGGGVGAGVVGGAGNNANGGSPGIIANHITANAGSAVNGSNGAAGFGGGGGGGVASKDPITPGGGGGGGGYIGGSGGQTGTSAAGGTSYVNNTEAGFSALYMSAVAGVNGGNTAYSGNGGSITVTSLPAPPTITSFSPLQGGPGNLVTITGTNFSTTTTNNTVYIGATKAAVTAASTTSLTITVSPSATNSVISVLNTETNLIAYSQQHFTPIFKAVKNNITLTDFAPRVNFTTGTNPGYVTMGDLDGDGKPDMVVTNETDNTVSVFLNTGSQGSPSFAAGITLVTGQSPQGVAIGDIDGDGKLDMAVTAFNGNLVSIFRNTSTAGNISFASKVDIDLGSCPFFVVIRDMDGDGRADLVTANKDANTVSIVLNTGALGNISFAARVDLAAGTKPYFVTVGDLDGDSKPDVAAAAYGDNKMVVFRNKSTVGVVSFDARQDFAVTTPYSISIGDLDGDEKLDLITGNLTSNNISIFRNTSVVGAISFASKTEIALGQRIYNVAIGDLNGNGKNDLVTSNYTNNTVSVLRNTGSAGSISFAPQVDISTGAGPNYVSIADIDADDKPDLLVSNYDDNTVSVIRNKPIGINVSGTLSAVNTTYGAASTSSTTFTVSGTNMKAGITVTPPAGYELSLTAGGASGYSGSGTAIVVGAAGTIVSTTVYARLAANLIAGAYSGNIVFTSTDATTENLATVSSTVSPAALTITATNASRTYRSATFLDAAVSTSFTATGLMNSETIGSVAITYNNVAGNGNVPGDAVGTYTGQITPSAATGGTFTASNYAVTYVAGNISITPASLIITAANASKTYGTTLTGGAGSTAFTSSGLQNSETVGSVTIAYDSGAGSGTMAADAVGSYAGKVTPSVATGGTFTASNYAITYVAGNISVTPASLTITATNASRTYRSATFPDAAVSTSFTATGLMNSETIGSVAITYNNVAGNGNVPGDAVGTYTGQITPSAATGGTFTASNYAVTYVAGNISITPASLIITAANASKTYGTTLTGGAGSTAFTSSGLQNSETIGSVTLAFTAGAGNGNTVADAVRIYAGKVTPSAATGGTFTASNYAITYVAGDISVVKATLIVTADAKSKSFGAIDPALTYTVSGLVGSDVLTGGLTRAVGESNGDYAITIGTLSAGTNYIINYTPAVLKIQGNTLTITANAVSKIYGAADPTLTYTVTGLVGNDVLTGSLTRAVGENIGDYATTLGTLSAGANYSINFTPAVLKIQAKPITVIADAKSKSFGAIDPALTYTVSGLVGSDVLTGGLTRAVGESNGDYAITIGTLSAGTNYIINYTPAVLKIQGNTLTITANAVSKIYGAADPTLTYTVTGLVGNDVLTGSLTRAVGENIGDYAISIGTLSAGADYVVNFTPSILKVNTKPLTVFADAKSKVYGATDPALTYTVAGLIGSDVLAGSLTRTNGEQAGAYSINKGSLSANANYSINYTASNLIITKAVLIVAAENKQICEGADMPIFTMSYSGFKLNDDVNKLSTKPTVTTTAKANSPAGNYILKPGSGVSANYEFQYFNAILAIVAKPIPVIASSKGNSVSKGETLTLTATGGTTYSWSNANGIISGQNTATLTARPTVTTTYFVSVGNANGCSETASYKVEVRDDFQAIVANNILSPNGDGFNDLWIVENIDLYPNNVVTIFSQTGRILFTQKSYKNTWDGKVNGLPLAEGTYYYVIDFGTNKLKQKGFITVIKQQ